MQSFVYFFMLFLLALLSEMRQIYALNSDPLMIRPLVGCINFPELGSLCGRGRCLDEATGDEVQEPNVPGSVCVCDSGWTGHSDSIDLANHSCTVLTAWYRIEWALSSLGGLMALLYIIYKLTVSAFHLQSLIQESFTAMSTNTPRNNAKNIAILPPTPLLSSTPSAELSTNGGPMTEMMLLKEHGIGEVLLGEKASGEMLMVPGSNSNTLSRGTPSSSPFGTPSFHGRNAQFNRATPSSTPFGTPSFHGRNSPSLNAAGGSGRPPTLDISTPANRSRPLPEHNIEVGAETPPLLERTLEVGAASAAHSKAPTTITYSVMISELLSWEIVRTSLWCLPVVLAICILSFLRVSPNGDTDWLIGRSYLSTFLFCVGTTGSYMNQKRTMLQFMNVRRKVARFTETDSDKVQRFLSKMKNIIYAAYVLDVCLFILYLLVPAYPDWANLILCIHHNVNGLSLFVMGCTIIYGGKKLTLIIAEGLDRLKGPAKTEREKALKNIQAIIEFSKKTTTAPLSMFMIALWPLLRMHVTWILGLGMLPALRALTLYIKNCQLPTCLQNRGAFEDLSTHLGTESVHDTEEPRKRMSHDGGRGGGGADLGGKEDNKALGGITEGAGDADYSPHLSPVSLPESALRNSHQNLDADTLNLPSARTSNGRAGEGAEAKKEHFEPVYSAVRTLDDSGIPDASIRGGTYGQSGGRSSPSGSDRDVEDIPIKREQSNESGENRKKIFNPFEYENS